MVLPFLKCLILLERLSFPTQRRLEGTRVGYFSSLKIVRLHFPWGQAFVKVNRMLWQQSKELRPFTYAIPTSAPPSLHHPAEAQEDFSSAITLEPGGTPGGKTEENF